jgi:SAM-dependent methyltransferase
MPGEDHHLPDFFGAHDTKHDLDLPANAQVLEIECGTGAISRVLARRRGIAQVVGIDPKAADYVAIELMSTPAVTVPADDSVPHAAKMLMASAHDVRGRSESLARPARSTRCLRRCRRNWFRQLDAEGPMDFVVRDVRPCQSGRGRRHCQ